MLQDVAGLCASATISTSIEHEVKLGKHRSWSGITDPVWAFAEAV